MSLRELLPILREWQGDGAGIGRAVLVRAFHSSPRAPGAVLLAADDGRFAGSVSGGCVEGAVADEVRRARRDGRSRVIRYGISDDIAWDVGLACGGIIDVLMEGEVRP
ncbi:MAG: XdhC family protein, partial [Chloroflexi bacterium]|nr:XdhC family protein [Chloroflexota bacterium]